MKTIKQAKWCYIICSVLLIAAGIYIMIKPYASAIIFCRVIGAVSLFYGISKILGYFSHDLYNLAFQFDLALGVFTLIFGLILLLRSARVVAFMPAILGVFVLVDGVFKLQTAVDAKRFGLSNWWLILLGLAYLRAFRYAAYNRPVQRQQRDYDLCRSVARNRRAAKFI